MTRTLFCAALVAFAGGAAPAADDKKDITVEKLMGKWEITKAGSDEGAPAGSTIEFLKDSKLKIKVKDFPMDIDGTFKLDGEKVTLTFKIGDNEQKETLTVTKLTEDVLHLKDEKDRTDELKKVKEKKDK